jgi:hypothetical protein
MSHVRSKVVAVVLVVAFGMGAGTGWALPVFCSSWDVILDDTTDEGHMIVYYGEDCWGGDRVKAVFTSEDEEVITLNATLGSAEVILPSGVVQSEVLTGNVIHFTVDVFGGSDYEFEYNMDGTPVTQADETSMLAAGAALESGSEDVLEAANTYFAATYYDPNWPPSLDQGDPEMGPGMLPEWADCAIATAGWIASYFGIIGGCGTLVLCLAAIFAHELAVIGFVNACF